jgi:hypothetical protein
MRAVAEGEVGRRAINHENLRVFLLATVRGKEAFNLRAPELCLRSELRECLPRPRAIATSTIASAMPSGMRIPFGCLDGILPHRRHSTHNVPSRPSNPDHI